MVTAAFQMLVNRNVFYFMPKNLDPSISAFVILVLRDCKSQCRSSQRRALATPQSEECTPILMFRLQTSKGVRLVQACYRSKNQLSWVERCLCAPFSPQQVQ